MYGKLADYYSLGVTLFELIEGVSPWSPSDSELLNFLASLDEIRIMTRNKRKGTMRKAVTQEG